VKEGLTMYAYTLAFIQKEDHILMINREKKPWKGCWNGLGGKLKVGEDPVNSVIRELFEETSYQITSEQVKDCGYLTWNTFDANGQGLYLYLIDGKHLPDLKTPMHTAEGILDWKMISWINDDANVGVAHNIKYFLPTMISSNHRYHYHCHFEGETLVSVTKELI
jgi:8-oxo-dGTP diphosphatase